MHPSARLAPWLLGLLALTASCVSACRGEEPQLEGSTGDEPHPQTQSTSDAAVQVGARDTGGVTVAGAAGTSPTTTSSADTHDDTTATPGALVLRDPPDTVDAVPAPVAWVDEVEDLVGDIEPRRLGTVTALELGGAPWHVWSHITALALHGHHGELRVTMDTHHAVISADGIAQHLVGPRAGRRFDLGNRTFLEASSVGTLVVDPDRGHPTSIDWDIAGRGAVLDAVLAGRRLLVATDKGQLHGIDLDASEVEWTAEGAFDPQLFDAVVVVGERIVVATDEANTLRAFGLEDGERQGDLGFDRQITSVAVDGEHLLMGDASGVVHRVTLTAGGDVTAEPVLARHESGVRHVEVVESLDRLVTCAQPATDGALARRAQGTLRLWSRSAGTLLGQLAGVECTAVVAGASRVYAARGFDVDWLELTDGRFERPVRLWRTPTAVAIGPDAGVVHFDEGFASWDAASGRVVLQGQGQSLSSAAPPDAHWLAWGGLKTPLQVVSLPARQPIALPGLDGLTAPTALTASGDGRLLFALVDETVIAWDVDAAQRVWQVEVSARRSVELVSSASGDQIFVIGEPLQLIETSAGAAPTRIALGRHGWATPAFSPGGTRVAWAAEDDRGVVVRDLATGDQVEIDTVSAGAGGIFHLAFVGEDRLAVGFVEATEVYALDAPDAPERVFGERELMGVTTETSPRLAVAAQDGWLELHDIAGDLPVETADGAVPDAILEPVAVHGRLATTGEGDSATVVWLWELDALEPLEILGDGKVLTAPQPIPAPSPPMSIAGSGRALRDQLGLAPDAEAVGEIVDGADGLVLRVGDETLLRVADVVGQERCEPAPVRGDLPALVFEDAQRSVALLFAEDGVDLASWDAEASCLRRRTAFAEPSGELLVHDSASAPSDPRQPLDDVLVTRRRAELLPQLPGLELIDIGELGVVVRDAQGASLFAAGDGSVATFGVLDYAAEYEPYEEIPGAAVEISGEPAGTLLVDVTVATTSEGPHGSESGSVRTLYRLRVSDDGEDFESEQLSTETTADESSDVANEESSSTSAEIERRLEGPGGTWIVFTKTADERSTRTYCDVPWDDDDDDDDDDLTECCETSSASHSVTGAWTHSELGPLAELPEVDEGEDFDSCELD